MQWRGKHYIFWTDYSGGLPVQRRVQCAQVGGDTAEDRAALLRKYRALEVQGQHAVLFGRGAVAYEASLAGTVAEYLSEIEKRVGARRDAAGARVGLAPASGQRIRDSIKRLLTWLEVRRLSNIRCGDLQARHLDDLRSWLATCGNSPHTVNLDLRNIRGCIGWIGRLRPERLRDVDLLAGALKAVPASAPEPEAFSADEIQKFYAAARGWNPAVADMFRFYACTGCRRGEALSLTWADVDLERGRITFRAQKTGRTRILPLIGAPEGDVAPGLLEWLRRQPARSPRETVFSHFPEKAWDNTVALVGIKILPQALRSNFTSYAASMGIPPSVCALWQGHSAHVAERFYRAQVLERKKATSLEGAMGFDVSDTLTSGKNVAGVV